jgi:hypothetical protein
VISYELARKMQDELVQKICRIGARIALILYVPSIIIAAYAAVNLLESVQ